VRIHLPARLAAVVAPQQLGKGLVGALHDALASRYRSTSPRSSARTSSGPLRSSSLKWSSVAQCGTRFELAISTRGASAWVRNTPTGLPDCTHSVSSASRSRRAATMRSKLSQSRAARPMPP
jgi:hypothetical protein